EVETMGFPNCLTNSNAILLSGTRIPTVFFFLNSFGKLLFPSKIKVYGPGKARFSILNVAVSKFLTYSEILLKSLQTNEKFAFSSFIPFILAIRSKAFELVISQPNP